MFIGTPQPYQVKGYAGTYNPRPEVYPDVPLNAWTEPVTSSSAVIMASPAPSSLFNEKPLLSRRASGSGSARPRKHNPILPYHKQVIKELASPEEDDLLVMAKGLGMRRVSAICSSDLMLDRS